MIILDRDLEPIHCEANKEEIKSSYADVTRARNILKFIASDNFESNLKQMLNQKFFEPGYQIISTIMTDEPYGCIAFYN